LATKSRRTLSTRRAQHQDLARRPKQGQLPLDDLASAGPLDELVDGVLGDRLRVPGVPEPQRGHVAELLAAVGVDDDDPVRHAVEGRDQAPARVRVRALVADLRAGPRRRRRAQPNRPVM
jgi:hypothetical protein